MANLLEDIQCAGFDTRPPMLDKADFAYISRLGTSLKLFVAEGTKGSLNLGPERPRVYSDLSQDEKDRCRQNRDRLSVQLQWGRPHSKELHSTQASTELRILQRQDVADVNITLPNYSKENFLATFTSQKQLTPEQIFWSQDIVKMKAEALKEQNTRPIKTLTVYPPNIPATLVPRVLPTKKHFDGIQKALKKEVKEMSDAFDELEAELDQHVVDRKHDEIERKNLIIEHDNIIADSLSKEVFYVALNSELNVSRFTEMQNVIMFRSRQFRLRNDTLWCYLWVIEIMSLVIVLIISRVYYVEGLGHNLFFVDQFCDSDLEVAFRKHSCYVCDTDGVELLKGSRGSNLYTISVEDMIKVLLICLLSKPQVQIHGYGIGV
ncbi:hypothetical protein Tco_1503521 [Tanacetum coccineum]